MLEGSLPKDVYWLVRMTSKNLKTRLRAMLEDHGITWPQFHTLYHINNEGIPINELAKKMRCNPSNLTGLIDRMTENDWVYREHSLEDRRVWLIKLTQEGSNLKEKMLPQHRKNLIKLMSTLNQEELLSLKKLLTKLNSSEAGEEKN